MEYQHVGIFKTKYQHAEISERNKIDETFRIPVDRLQMNIFTELTP
jgi:hypothetical protein